jgi:putative Holliday junction resolvase
MPEKSAAVIGFDFGTYWIGVAVGQTLTRQATPLPAIRNNDWKRIAGLIAEWQPRRLVVGLPLGMDGEHQEMTARAQRFGRQLQGRFGIETSMVDERLTTREAWQIVSEQDRHRSKPEIDSLAAALITESWLQNEANR